MNCPRCSRVMQAMGNVSGIIYTSHPAQWDETYVCHHCRVKVAVRCMGKPHPDLSWLNGYEQVIAGDI